MGKPDKVSQDRVMSFFRTEEDLFWVLGIGPHGKTDLQINIIPAIIKKIYGLPKKQKEAVNGTETAR
jgi:hypothetical protein